MLGKLVIFHPYTYMLIDSNMDWFRFDGYRFILKYVVDIFPEYVFVRSSFDQETGFCDIHRQTLTEFVQLFSFSIIIMNGVSLHSIMSVTRFLELQLCIFNYVYLIMLYYLLNNIKLAKMCILAPCVLM